MKLPVLALLAGCTSAATSPATLDQLRAHEAALLVTRDRAIEVSDATIEDGHVDGYVTTAWQLTHGYDVSDDERGTPAALAKTHAWQPAALVGFVHLPTDQVQAVRRIKPRKVDWILVATAVVGSVVLGVVVYEVSGSIKKCPDGSNPDLFGCR
jgi:hypothetical protein